MAATDEGEQEQGREPGRGRWIAAAALALALAGVLVLSTLLIAGGDSRSEVEFLPGRTIEVPNDLAELSRQEALIAILDGVSDAAGYTDEFRDCVAAEIQGLSDSELGNPGGQQGALPKRTDQLLSASGRCGAQVDAVLDPDATPEQLGFLRELTATQIGGLLQLLPENAGVADCVPDRIRALSDERLRLLVDGPGGLASSIEALERRCRAQAKAAARG